MQKSPQWICLDLNVRPLAQKSLSPNKLTPFVDVLYVDYQCSCPVHTIMVWGLHYLLFIRASHSSLFFRASKFQISLFQWSSVEHAWP
jgi:hypothetical protein